jgi:DNA-binding CsgD family transcriptional regulator
LTKRQRSCCRLTERGNSQRWLAERRRPGSWLTK